MNPNYLTRAELADFGRNAAAKVAGGKVSGLLAAQIASVSAAIAYASADLADADGRQVELRAAAIEATRIAEQNRKWLLKLLQDLKYLMKSLQSQAHEYDAVGFDPPVIGRRPVIPLTPIELAARGFSNGVNELSFVGNNLAGRVAYLIEAKAGESLVYTIIGTTKAQRYKHHGVKPGVPIQYRVRAQAARGTMSECSNEAAVYMPLE
jgi:hypothetical protein